LPYNASTALPGPYMLPAYQLDVKVVETNKVATMPVRGAGYPEGAFAMERLLDAIADTLGLDRAEGRYLGIGVGNGVKGTGRGPFESGIVRIGRSGRISVYTGAMPMGQGIRTALAQICAEQFDVAPDSIAVAAGDTAVIPYGQGGFASRQTVTAG